MLWCNFLLAETEVVMTTLTSWHVYVKNCIFTGYDIFFPEKSWYFTDIYMINRQVQKSERIESAFSMYLKSVAACTSKILFCCDFTTNVLCI